MVLEGTISGSTKNLSNQGSLKNNFLKEFFEEPIKVSQRTLKNGSLRPYLWFLKVPFKLGFFKAPFLVSRRTFQTRVL